MPDKIAIYSKEGNPKTAEVIKMLIEEFSRRGTEVLLYQKDLRGSDGRAEGNARKFSDLKNLDSLPELVLSVGGDGTFLETALNIRTFGIPVAGVNTGRMGFLANIPVDGLAGSVDQLCRGEYKVIERALLEITHPEGLFGTESQVALNEITFQKTDPGMITISVYTDDVYLNTYWADGLIVSTATGSTAYNLSVGGPILSPEDQSIIISPISSHNLTNRPIIVTGDTILRMQVGGRSCGFLATCDSKSGKAEFGKEIRIRQTPEKLKTIMLRGTDFYSTLRNKLMWGADRRN
jgi:NAD+ kinase